MFKEFLDFLWAKSHSKLCNWLVLDLIADKLFSVDPCQGPHHKVTNRQDTFF
jgi:hypothetical protein